jgi:predicted NAD-dependent protein-ADP-ribosyltransferase YbiA (DUF1768 family)
VALRLDWDKMKLFIMASLLRQKFSDPALGKKLLDTKHIYLIEGNNWGDDYWGVYEGRGTNHLGVLLMNLRDELRKEEKDETKTDIS